MAVSYERYINDERLQWNNTLYEIPDNNRKVMCLIEGEMNVHICTFRDGFFEKYQMFTSHCNISRYRVHYWIYKEDYEKQKNL